MCICLNFTVIFSISIKRKDCCVNRNEPVTHTQPNLKTVYILFGIVFNISKKNQQQKIKLIFFV